MTTAFLAWRAPASRRWYTVGRLHGAAPGDAGEPSAGAYRYRFEYTGGAEQAQREAGFAPLASFPDLRARYLSDALFAFFNNRLLPRSRPEYREYVEWLSVAEAANDPVALLARSGGARATDEFELYPFPTPDGSGELRMHCFVHGVRYFAGAQARLDRLRAGDALLAMHDFQNPVDPDAVVLRTPGTHEEEGQAVGYLPRYVAPEVHRLRAALVAGGRSEALRVTVERLNPASAPLGLRLLCRVVSPWPVGYAPFADAAHRPIDTPREVVVGGQRPRPVAVA